MYDLTTPDGVVRYTQETAPGSSEDWNNRCTKVKEANDGVYPPFWFPAVIVGGIYEGRLGSVVGMLQTPYDKV